MLIIGFRLLDARPTYNTQNRLHICSNYIHLTSIYECNKITLHTLHTSGRFFMVSLDEETAGPFNGNTTKPISTCRVVG